MIGTVLGVAVGVLATALVARYYFRRSRLKSLSPFLLLESDVFVGLDAEDRKRLRVEYMDKEVSELHELEFLIGNDGELPIAQSIEPLTLHLPVSADVLDASILYRSPPNLAIAARVRAGALPAVVFEFPLLNKGDCFAVKLLLSGRARSEDCKFSILAEDLPRELKPLPFPEAIGRDDRLPMGGVAIFSLITGVIFGYVLLALFRSNPALFAWTAEYESSFASTIVVPSAMLLTFCLLFLGGVLVLMLFLDVVVGAPFNPPPELGAVPSLLRVMRVAKRRGPGALRLTAREEAIAEEGKPRGEWISRFPQRKGRRSSPMPVAVEEAESVWESG